MGGAIANGQPATRYSICPPCYQSQGKSRSDGELVSQLPHQASSTVSTNKKGGSSKLTTQLHSSIEKQALCLSLYADSVGLNYL